MTVKYEEAMETLTTMFGSIDKEVIDAVLRANDFHMERTIDNLLTMSDSSGTPSLAPQLPPLTEPISDTPTVNPQQIEQDEMLARALQNELFLAEVRANPELAAEESTFDTDLTIKEVKEKFNQLGEAAKSKLRDLSTMFFSKKDEKYEAVSTDPLNASPTLSTNNLVADGDDEEIIAFDRYA
eukprot:Phypoly_transcript_11884.p2 GENE.Phypoly_transcript_11884~~Phypoly_transcript_11884.p2  ORF type:complete len:183 (+),score=39.07 Phypoly_transcript_11884:218-766(+)